MKELAATYLITDLNHGFRATTTPYIPRKVRDGALSPDEHQRFYLNEQLLRFTRQQYKGVFYRRLYQASSALWLLTEAITLTNAVQYSDLVEYKETRAAVSSLLDGLSSKDLFAVCEIENFLYGFLLPKIFARYARSPVLLQQLCWRLRPEQSLLSRPFLEETHEECQPITQLGGYYQTAGFHVKNHSFAWDCCIDQGLYGFWA